MKKQSFFSAMLFLMAAFVIFDSCSHPSEYGDVNPQGDGYGRIAVNINANTARTVLPAAVFDSYVYSFTKESETTGTELSPDSGGFFTLEVGIYTVLVSAYIGKAEPYTLAATGVSAPFTVSSGDNDPVTVYLSEANTREKGEFAYLITYPEEAWGEITLQKYPEMIAVGLSPSHVCEANGLSETVELTAGIYLLTVQVTMHGRYAGVTEVVHIYPSLTTIYDKDFIDEDFTASPPDGGQPPEPPTEPPIFGNIKFEYFWIDQHDDLITTNNGAVSIIAGETLTITSLVDGSFSLNWYLNGRKTAESGNTFNFSSETAGNHTVGLFIEKNGKIYNTNIVITVEGTTAGFTRSITIDMFDQNGDGWGSNAALRVNIDGVDIANNIRVSNISTANTPIGQRNTNTYTFTTTIGSVVEIFWVAGSTQGENSFIVFYTDKPPLPVFNTNNSNNWIGENALIFKLRGTMNAISNGTLLGTFTVS